MMFHSYTFNYEAGYGYIYWDNNKVRWTFQSQPAWQTACNCGSNCEKNVGVKKTLRMLKLMVIFYAVLHG